MPAQPLIRYSYTASGQSYVSTELWPGQTLNNMPLLSSRSRERLLRDFAAGHPARVYFDPKSPNHSALIPGPSHALRWISVFIFFLLLGIWSPLALMKLWRRTE